MVQEKKIVKNFRNHSFQSCNVRVGTHFIYELNYELDCIRIGRLEL